MACSVFRGPRFISSILRSSRTISGAEITPKIPAIITTTTLQQPLRHSSFRSSPLVRDLQEYPEVEIVRNPPEWKYVERLLRPQTVPIPPKKVETLPSGWKPQRTYDPKSDKYFVRRTKNHMVPVYLMKTYRGMRQVTLIRYVLGDIWALEKDLRKVVEASQDGKVCASRVNEMSGQITFHGDYVDVVKKYLEEQGF
ncbi:unnamed protein product [Hermetia illucens]|uniref:Large ribosomal subunit protein mL49 n=1 Tax=Hermetia illucens TaxID=343691 RepID=A0A7R8UU67_HERIL|nr:probable 39S ribosomal protein L49, mitochondrial [Hermetia illucens]CAD7087126.1 unnamed protein product [Hermetia illucens]